MEPDPVTAEDPTGYFSDRADAYARWRPGYPSQAIELALSGLNQPLEVLDVGCGTGISTRALHATGSRVVGVEPDSAMLAQAQAKGGPRYVVGRAEALPVDDSSQDVVAVGQAFHWFDRDPSLREFHRVLRPGGRLALIWNVRQKDTPFMAAYAAVVTKAQWYIESTGRLVSRDRCASPAESPWFKDAEQHSVPNDDQLEWEAVVGRISSASYFPRVGPQRERLLAELRAAFDEHAVDGRVTYAQQTELTLATRA